MNPEDILVIYQSEKDHPRSGRHPIGFQVATPRKERKKSRGSVDAQDLDIKTIKLEPAVNLLPLTDWEAIKVLPTYQDRIANGSIIEVQRRPLKEGESYTGDIVDYDQKDCFLIIEFTFDLEVLQRIKVSDPRPVVVEWAKEQHQKVSNKLQGIEIAQGQGGSFTNVRG